MYLHAKLELDFPFSNWQDLSHPNSHLWAILAGARASHPHNWLPQVDIKLIARGTCNIENRDVIRQNFRWCCCMHDSSTGDSNSTESLASFSSIPACLLNISGELTKFNYRHSNTGKWPKQVLQHLWVSHRCRCDLCVCHQRVDQKRCRDKRKFWQPWLCHQP